MNELELSMIEAAEEFVFDDHYTWMEEFKKRSFRSGSYMPLTYYCFDLEVDFRVIPAIESEYADYKMKINAKYTLTELGRRKMIFLKENYNLERTTVGTLAFWLFRKNERKRQVKEIKSRSKHVDWQTLKVEYVRYRDLVIKEVYVYAIDKAIDYLTSILKKKAWSHWLSFAKKYIAKLKKKQVSMVGVGYNRFPYKFMEWCSPKFLITKFIQVLNLIKDNFYSKKRLNPKFMLTALRGRPMDIKNEDMSETEMEGEMFRSREALGQPPFSLFWMFIYEIKKDLMKYCLGKISEIYGIDFYDPIRNNDFYFRFTQKQDGLYLFGDNGMLILEGKIVVMYDLSISDVFQGWLRRSDDGDNFCFFVRLNEYFDCGSTGDAFTTLWNIEGQVFLWRVFKDGKLTTDKNWPEIKDLCEEAGTFLGHFWSEILQDWITKGVRLTTDNAKKMISFSFRRGTRVKITWPHKDVIPANEFLSLAISSGMLSDCGLTKFYEWIEEKKKLDKVDVFDEEEGVVEQIKKAKDIKGFMTLTKDNLSELAKPYILSNYRYEVIVDA